MGCGMNLKRVLRGKGMTIKELSEKSGVSINTLYAITKRDSKRIDKVILEMLSDALNVPTEYIMQ